MEKVNAGSFADYAKHRGVSKAAVSKGRKKGWFGAAIGVRNGKEYVTDFGLADRLWEQHADQSRASIETKERLSRISKAAPPQDKADAQEASIDEEPALSSSMSLADATKADKYWSAMKKKQEFETAAGILVNAAERDVDETTRVTFAKTRLLGIPSKLKATLPHLQHGDIAIVDALIREALEELADEGKNARGEAA